MKGPGHAELKRLSILEKMEKMRKI